MSESYERGLTLFEERRFEAALAAFREAGPMNGPALAHAALCLLELDAEDEADQAARQAVQISADEGAAWYAVARVALRRDQLRQAENAIRRALQLSPVSASYLSVAARIQQQRHRWPEALAIAEQALVFDPRHVESVTIRARSLIKLGRIAEGRAVIRESPVPDVDSPLLQAEEGWTELENGRPEVAVEAFVQALQADPELEWARDGLAASLRSPFPLYRPMLRYFLRLQRYRSEQQMMAAMGEVLVSRVVEHVGRRSPRLRRFALWYMTIRALLVYLSWIARPMSNLLLLIHPDGRDALTRDGRSEGAWAAAGVVAIKLSLVGCFFLDRRFPGPSLVALIESLLLMSVLSSTYDCRRGWPRQVMSGIAFSLLGIALYAYIKLVIWFPDWSGWDAFSLFVSGTVLADLAAWFLRRIRPQRPRKSV